MIHPLRDGAFPRAVVAPVCLFLLTAPAFSSGAGAAVDHRLYMRRDLHGRGHLFNSTEPAAPFAVMALRVPAPVRAAKFAGVTSLIAAEAVALNVPVRLAVAVARFESGLRMSMRGAAGERGAMQVLPQTARQVGVAGNLYGAAGIEAGVRYLRLAMALHGRAGWCAVASAYNGGVWRRSHCTAYGRAVVALAGLR